MIPKIQVKATLLIVLFFCSYHLCKGQEVAQQKQYCSKSKVQQTTSKKTITNPVVPTAPRPSRKVSIPKNYIPPVAKDHEIIFPETYAGIKKQRFLRKKRKKSKQKGCIARAF